MQPLDVSDYELLARHRLSPLAWAYYSDGAEDGVTLRANREAFEHLHLVPRVLRGVGSADLNTVMLGTPVGMPVLVAPTGVHGFAHPEAECATARAAGSAGTIMAISSMSSRPLAEISASATGPLWFQLYVYHERRISEILLRRAERAGCRAIVLTVDSPRWGRKRGVERAEAEAPWAKEFFSSVEKEFAAADLRPAPLSWADVAWLRNLTDLALILKGILAAEDAALAVEHGAAGVVVSNHGGRQLDGAVASIEALPEVVEAVAGRAEVYLDGGVRRGTDVLKACALGARAVMVGRPVLWGLAAGGEDGVRHVLTLLRDELELAMVLAGQPDIKNLDADLIKSF